MARASKRLLKQKLQNQKQCLITLSTYALDWLIMAQTSDWVSV